MDKTILNIEFVKTHGPKVYKNKSKICEGPQTKFIAKYREGNITMD